MAAAAAAMLAVVGDGRALAWVGCHPPARGAGVEPALDLQPDTRLRVTIVDEPEETDLDSVAL